MNDDDTMNDNGTKPAKNQSVEELPGQHGQGHIAQRQGQGGGVPERFANPGLPPHVHRLADFDEKAANRAERQVATLFSISMLATLAFLVAYFAIDQETYAFVPGIGQANLSNLVLGLTLGLSLLCIGLGATPRRLAPASRPVVERPFVLHHRPPSRQLDLFAIVRGLR